MICSIRLVISLAVLIVLIFQFNSCKAEELNQKSIKPSDKILMVHYMPWFASKPVSGHWGWHWTMNHFDPESTDENGKRKIASHHYPLIGPYDSNDPEALECQVLLMKFAGIQGVIIDWYGTEKFYDYAITHRNTEHIIKYAKKAKLKFAICYEDQTVKHMVNKKHIEKEADVAQGRKAMDWLGKNWFSVSAYLKQDDRPVLLVFGPQYFEKQQWSQLFSTLTKKPMFYCLPHLVKKAGADSGFVWPPVTGGKTVKTEQWQTSIKRLHKNQANDVPLIAGAFPGFHDIYKQAKLHDSYGFISDENGKTLSRSLNLAYESNAKIIQIATWNDYGEGTGIEPTKEFEYQHLETIQKTLRKNGNKNFEFSANDLRLPILLYRLKKKYAGDIQKIAQLNKTSELLFDGKTVEAIVLLQNLTGNQ